ncbi:bifunctional DNA-formamidopyrimidine glycosylase/DNA-(apurinic or apyrimidinic site) lyase [Microbacterium sp. AR7-10]|uniref:bifunctional DNA-formamidopyrimidine glycosylase/DNA-(apurinic or apyrimidinic site) lyase n=1 Tax=Microbacterium sp. AR7-10 TaxID=1891970 RepID=UPI0008FC9707|nr:bifunctional DNA-formamidopyrimidine glycosylase/DNA-(apurinic or apyrimidinic site) lyase [Microbacterium sp. AR7-10]OIU86137.1 DNA-formamidopyrimidine glycosylase [Microbacterium sp. AR7-10]
MPELPEVEVVRHGLAPAVTGARVLSVDVLDERALTRHPRDAADFVGRLEGREVRAAARRGKFLWLPLDERAGEPEALVAHLGMSGQMLLRDPDAPLERHERVRLRVEHARHGVLAVVFADQRTFGSLAVDALLPTPDAAPGGYGTADPLVPSQVAHIARDPLDPAFDERDVITRIRRRSSAIKRILLDQSLVSGIGNIYADESLWAARIHPETHGTAISVQALRRLMAEVRLVLEKALAEGGTSFDAQYVNVNGQAGYFAHSLNAYGRGGKPCPRCGGPIRREAFMNRSSHYCPRCQRRR